MGYDIEFLNEIDQGGLMLRSEIFFCGTHFDVTHRILEEEKFLNEFYSASNYRRLEINIIKHCAVECSNNSSL